jgi:hypothetical protein
MRRLWVVAGVELRLRLRGRGVLALALALVALGALAGSWARQIPWAAWNHLGVTAFGGTLLLALASGGQVRRDRAHRLDGVLLATPLPTAAYVAGTYLASLATHLGLAGIGLAAALLTDRFDAWTAPPLFLGRADFPPLGPAPYLASWGLLVAAPLVFGTALALAATTLLPGGRAAAAAVVVALWLAPFLAPGWPVLLEVTGTAAGPLRPLGVNRALGQQAHDELVRAELLAPGEARTGALPGAVKTRLAAEARAALPPRLPAAFWWNRALLLAAGAGLLALTIGVVASGRGGGRRPPWRAARRGSGGAEYA